MDLGILCEKFRIHYRLIQSLPVNVDNIILRTSILLNFIRYKGALKRMYEAKKIIQSIRMLS